MANGDRGHVSIRHSLFAPCYAASPPKIFVGDDDRTVHVELDHRLGFADCVGLSQRVARHRGTPPKKTWKPPFSPDRSERGLARSTAFKKRLPAYEVFIGWLIFD